ncbi:MAG: TVP38/TMEM64 family protein [Pseudolabrys sp.]
MSVRNANTKTSAAGAPAWPLRIAILAVFVALIAIAYATGWHRLLTLETLVRHRAAIDAFIGAHYFGALAIYIGIYVISVSLSIPASLLLTVAGGILFGVVVGSLAAIVSSASGGTIVFLIARTALGEGLLRRAGPFAAKFAEGFRADAFSYLLFLRLVPLFPFWLVNLAPALFGVNTLIFITATVLGIAPAAFAYAFVGAGLDSVIAAQEAAYRDCLAAGRDGCRLNFELRDAVTPELVAAFVALGLIALIPVVLRRLRARKPKRGQAGS